MCRLIGADRYREDGLLGPASKVAHERLNDQIKLSSYIQVRCRKTEDVVNPRNHDCNCNSANQNCLLGTSYYQATAL